MGAALVLMIVCCIARCLFVRYGTGSRQNDLVVSHAAADIVPTNTLTDMITNADNAPNAHKQPVPVNYHNNYANIPVAEMVNVNSYTAGNFRGSNQTGSTMTTASNTNNNNTTNRRSSRRIPAAVSGDAIDIDEEVQVVEAVVLTTNGLL